MSVSRTESSSLATPPRVICDPMPSAPIMFATLPCAAFALVVQPAALAPARLMRSTHSRSHIATMTMNDKEVCVDEICMPSLTADMPKSATSLDELIKKGTSSYAEDSREFRRTVYMHDEWVKHRSSDRFLRNMATIGSSGVGQSLGKELSIVGVVALFAVAANAALVGYTGFDGALHDGPLQFIGQQSGALSLPAMPFTVAMPALSLLLVFRTNTGYARWNEARTLWGGVVNNCRNVVRQANTFFPDEADKTDLKEQLAANTAAFCKALRNFLRGPSDDATFRSELDEMVYAGLISSSQVDACMAAKNRPMFCLNAMSANLKAAGLDPIQASSIDRSISTLVDLTGACERIFKSPIPLIYTRHTSRFLTTFLLFLPFGIWPAMDKYAHSSCLERHHA